MKNHLVRLTIFTGFVAFSFSILASPAAAILPATGLGAKDNHKPDTASNRYIVVFKDSVSAPAKLARRQTESRNGRLGFIYRHALKGYSAELSGSAADRLRKDARIRSVTRDHALRFLNQTVPTGIDRVFATANEALDIDEEDDVRIDANVAVIDTGIGPHEDLNVVGSIDCETEGTFCKPGGGYSHWHGSHVAGTIGAIDNGKGVVGVAPGARLWNVRVELGPTTLETFESSVTAAVDWIAQTRLDGNPDNDIEVANMSFGCFEISFSGCPDGLPALDSAISDAIERGIVIVVAAGNYGENALRSHPAAHPEVITVSALADYDGEAGGEAEELAGDCESVAQTAEHGADDALAAFSNWGHAVEVAAPGVCILSTLPSGQYGFSSGTSMASPHAAGVAAILAAEDKPESKEDVIEIRQKLTESGNLNWNDSSPDVVVEPLIDLGGPEQLSVATDGISTPDASSVTLNGRVDPGGLETSYWFEYGATTAYGHSVPVAPEGVGSGTALTKVSKRIEGLPTNSTYHYRLVATNSSGTVYGPDRVFALSNWSVQPGVGRRERLSSVDCPSTSNCVAVGYERVDLEDSFWEANSALAMHWDGSEWTKQDVEPVPQLDKDPQHRLVDVSCSSVNSCMAVGDTDGALLGERWDGSEWHTSFAPLPADIHPEPKVASFNAVFCTSGNSCTAVGQYVSDRGENGITEEKTLVEVWNGSKWSIVPSPSFENEFNSLSDVYCLSATSCWAVGQRAQVNILPTGQPAGSEDRLTAKALVLHWDGGKWLTVPTPNAAEGGSYLTGVSCSSPTSCMAVGRNPVTHLSQDDKGFSLKWNDVAWSVETPAKPLVGVSCSAVDFCIGVAGTGERWNGSEWATEAFPFFSPLPFESPGAEGVSCRNVCTAVGGVILKRAKPLAVTDPASEVLATTATLNGTVNGKSSETTYQFEYGPTTSYGSKSPASPQSVGAGEAVEVDETVTSLTPGTTYHFRLAATDGEGTAYGEDRTFTTPAPLAAYSFDEGEGSVLGDSAGEHDGAIEGASWSEAGKYGSALAFDGEDDLVSIADAAELDLTGQFTLEAWVRPDEATLQPVLSKAEGAPASGYLLDTVADGKPRGAVGDSTTVKAVSGPSALPAEAWSHLALTSDGATMRLYVDGALVSSAAAVHAKGSVAALEIGHFDTTYEGFFDGLIDEVRIYGVPLSEEQVQVDRDSPVDPTPLATYSFEEGEGSTLGDSAGEHDGAIEGAAWSEAGKYGSALDFDGEDDLVSIADAAELDLTGHFTLEAWVRPDTLVSWGGSPLFSKISGSGGSLAGYRLVAQGESGPLGRTANAGTLATVTDGDPLPTGEWSHLTFTFDGENLRLYVDGVLEAVESGIAAGATEAALEIGHVAPDKFFEGLIDEVRIYGVPLSEAQIQVDRDSAVG